MKITLNGTQALLLVVAGLLALNLVATLSDPGRGDAPDRAPAFIDSVMPQAQAASVLRLEDFLITTNQQGDVLYVWRPGQIVGNAFRSIEVNRFDAN